MSGRVGNYDKYTIPFLREKEFFFNWVPGGNFGGGLKVVEKEIGHPTSHINGLRYVSSPARSLISAENDNPLQLSW